MLIFTRNPELGKCKTRLAATIGDVAALEIYQFLLQHTAKITEHLPMAKHVYYSENIWENDVWDDTIYAKKLQQGTDLGIRMANAFLEGLEGGFEKICIIGSDNYDLTQQDIEQAYSALDDNDYVIGPALDGGYYLLGLKKWAPRLFKNKEWGTANVLEATLNDLKSEKVYLLSAKNDIDTFEDIKGQKIFSPFIKHMEND
ncbi:MAG: TIGR04282 family arsenosugar biosynthesis glycosyltransferase [Flavobacteriaceae bacterium]